MISSLNALLGSQITKIARKIIKTASVSSLVIGIGLAGLSIAAAEDYKHKDWPVSQIEPGVYKFNEVGLDGASALCAAFYAADIEVMKENGMTTSPTGEVVYAHALEMQSVFMKSALTDQSNFDELVKDMTWHFGNAAQYGVFQEFKDSANSACENNAIENDLITVDFIIAFNDKLIASLTQ